MRYYRNYGAKNINLAPIDDLVKVLPTQEQTGKIVTFDSPFAELPLKSHKIALTATQSGSGTPSPYNVRTISGWSAINIGNDNVYTDFIEFNQLLAQNKLISSTSINGLDITNNNDGSFTIDGTSEASFSLALTTAITVPRKSHKVLIRFNTLPTNVTLFVSGYGWKGGFNSSYFFYETDGTDWPDGKLALTIPLGAVFDNFRLWLNYYDLTVMFGETEADEIYNQGDAGLTYFKSLFPNDYYEYNAGTLTTVSAVNGSTNSFFTINLGGTYYGGEYDARTGVLTVTHMFFTLDYTSNWRTDIMSGLRNFYTACPSDIKAKQHGSNSSMLCSASPISTSYAAQKDHCYISIAKNLNYTWGDTLGIDQPQDFKDYLQANNIVIEVVAELATPQTIQLPPCPIDTLEGVNNIWADTGDTTVQYFKK